MTEKAEKEKKIVKAQVPVAKTGGAKPPAQAKKSSSSSNGNGSNGSHGGKVDKPTVEKKSPPSAEDMKRYEKYVGQKWTGKCRWFNVNFFLENNLLKNFEKNTECFKIIVTRKPCYLFVF